MKKVKTISLVLLGGTLMSGCVSTQLAYLKPQSDKDIEVFMTTQPQKHYSEIAYIEASGGIFNNKKQLLNKLKIKAQKEGADAIANVKFDYTGWWPYVEGVAIKYDSK